MSNNRITPLCAALAITAVAGGVSAQELGGPPPTPGQSLMYGFASAGLLSELGSYEDFGTVQSRIGQSRAEIEASRASGVTTGYEDAANVGVLPYDFVYELPGGEGVSFLRFGGVASFNQGEDNRTQLYARTFRNEIEYLHSPTNDVLYGFGVFSERVDVDLMHNDGSIDEHGFGIRGDYLQTFNEHWGIAARAEYLWSDSETTIPLGGGVNYAYDQDWGRFYSQASLVGTYSHEALNFVPEGWMFHPSFGVIYQHNRFDDALDNFGGTVSGTVGSTDNYALLSASARLEDMDLRPGRFAPYVEIGLEHEVANDLNLIVDDPTSLHFVVGGTLNLGKGALVHLEYGRHDGLNGLRRDQGLTTHLLIQF